jgi:hypothetical protein
MKAVTDAIIGAKYSFGAATRHTTDRVAPCRMKPMAVREFAAVTWTDGW